MAKRILVALGALSLAGCATFPNPFVSKIKVPYFEPLTSKQMCGGFNRYCQPTSSTTFERIKEPVDYDGNPGSLLGRSYALIYETAPCTAVPTFISRDSTTDEVIYFGQSGVAGKVSSDMQGAFNAGISADIDKFVQQTFPNFPQEFKSAAKAKLQNKMQSALQQNASITYHRMDLTLEFRDTKLEACLDRLPSNRKVITGVSLITVSGDWSQTALQETLTELETTAEFRNLNADLKASFSQRKSIALQGKFEALAVPFAIAYRQGRGPIA